MEEQISVTTQSGCSSGHVNAYTFRNFSGDTNYINGVEMGLIGYSGDTPIYAKITYGDVVGADAITFAQQGMAAGTVFGMKRDTTYGSYVGEANAKLRIFLYSDENYTQSLAGTTVKGYIPFLGMTVGEVLGFYGSEWEAVYHNFTSGVESNTSSSELPRH